VILLTLQVLDQVHAGRTKVATNPSATLAVSTRGERFVGFIDAVPLLLTYPPAIAL
jgi:hypothetical protein